MVKIRKFNIKETYYSQKGYAILKDGNEECVNYLRQLLTVEPKQNTMLSNEENRAFPVYRENSKKIYIPRCLGFEMFGLPKHDTIHEGIDCPNLIFKGNLRSEQMSPVNAFIEAAKDPLRRGGIISVGCGFGKTILSLYLTCVFKKKTLVLCHKEFLINQWKERIAEFIPTATVGLIKAKQLDYKNKDIVIGSVQSISMKEYDAEIFSDFTFIICDETHHLSSEVFSRALPKINAQIMLGLSATLDRKDGLRKVFEWYLGKPVFQQKGRTENELFVHIINVPNDYPCAEYGKELVMWNGKKNCAAMINAICDWQDRNNLIIATLQKVLERDPGRRVLILSDRKGHLKILENEIKQKNLGTIGYYVGGMKEPALKESEGKDIILGTYPMASEGMDIPVLNTLILASPISSIEQSIGRVQRQKPHERKYVPMVIDVCDNFSLYTNQSRKRIEFYKKNGYTFIDGKGDIIDNKKSNNYDEDDDDIAESSQSHSQSEAKPKSSKYKFIDSDDD